MAFIDELRANVNLDPSLKKKLEDINSSFNQPTEQRDRFFLRNVFKRKEEPVLRFDVKEGTGAQSRIQQIAKEELEKKKAQQQKTELAFKKPKTLFKKQEPFRFEVGEGLPATGQQRAQQTLDRSTEIARREEKAGLLTGKEPIKIENKRNFALDKLADEAKGVAMSDQEEELMQEGLREIGIDVFGITAPLKGPIKAGTKKIISEISPLIKKARKFKTADEFVRKESFNPNSTIEYHISPDKNLSKEKLFSEQKLTGEIGERGFAGKQENIGQIFTTKNPQQWSRQLNLEGNKKPQYVYLVEVKNPAKVDIMEGLPHQSINVPGDVKILKKIGGENALSNPSIMEKAKLSQLTDIWNKANKVDVIIGPVTGQSLKDIERKVVSQNFRVDKLNLPDEHLVEIEKRLNTLGLKDRTVRTFGEMEEAALELGMDPGKLLKETSTFRIKDSEVIALRNLINTNSEFIANSEKQLAENPNLSRQLQPKIDIANQQLNKALTKVTKGGTEAGRTVTSFRILANKTMEPDVWLRKAQKETGLEVLPNDIIVAIKDLTGKKDLNGLVQFMTGIKKSSNIEKAVTLWKAGLLTSPTTQLANIGGNLTMRGLLNLSDIAAGPLDKTISMFTGKRTTTFSPKTISAQIKGALKGTKEAGKFLKTGVYSEDLLTKYDLPQQTNFNNKILDGYTKSIFRTLGAGDIVFRQAAMQESLEKQAWVVAKNEGMRGAAFKQRVKELLQNPTNEMTLNAIDSAEYATFQSSNALSDLITGGKGKLAGKIKSAKAKGESAAGAKATLAAAEVLAPFTKTPTNIAARIADFSPLGFIKAFNKLTKPTTASQKEFVEDFSRAATGSGFIGFGAYLAQKGLMTGNAPTDKAERDDFFASGKQPNSILIDGKWRKLDRVSPLGNLLALGAEIDELSNEGFTGRGLAVQATLEGVKGLTEQTFLKGISGGLKALNEPEQGGQAFVEQTAASVIPSVVGRIAKTIDPELKDPEGAIQAIQDKLPFLRSKLPERRDVLGNKIIVAGGRATLVDPFSSTEAKNSPVLKEAERLDLTIGVPTRTVSGIKLDNFEFSQYQKIQGKALNALMTEVINSDVYKEANDFDKVEMFEDSKSKIRRSVNDSVIPALMIIRYELPVNTNPKLIKSTIKAIETGDATKNNPQEKKNEIIKNVINQFNLSTF